MIQEQGLDFRLAKEKAATRLGLGDARALPSNREIAARLMDRQHLFKAEEHTDRLDQLRQLALQLMGELAIFSPRAVGGLVDGILSPNAAIELHVFAGAVEAVCDRLQVLGYRYRLIDKRLAFRAGERSPFPCVRIDVDEVTAELVVFDDNGIRQAPLSPVDGKPMRRLKKARLAELATS